MKKLFQSRQFKAARFIIPMIVLLALPAQTRPTSAEQSHPDFSSLDPKKIHGRHLFENLDHFDQSALDNFLNTISWGVSMPHWMVSMKVGKDRANQLAYYTPILTPLLKTKKSLKNTHSRIRTYFSPEERLAIANEYLTYYLSFGGDKDAIESVHELTLKKLSLSDEITIPDMIHQLKRDSILRSKFERTKYEFLIGLAALWIQREQYEQAS